MDRLKELEDLHKLDDIVENEADGIWVLPIPDGAPQYNYKSITAYCEKIGIKTSDLSDKELKQFEVGVIKRTPARVS